MQDKEQVDKQGEQQSEKRQDEQQTEKNGWQSEQDGQPQEQEQPEMVSRAEYDRLRLEMTAERLLAEAGARNLAAAKALLQWQDIDLQNSAWQETLSRRVQELRRGRETAFLFGHERGDEDWRWQGLQPAVGGDAADIYGEDGGYAFRLAQAGNGMESIRIKQEAAANGVIL